MSFNSQAFAKVGQAFAIKRDTAEFTADRHIKEARQAVRGFKEIDDQIAELGRSLGLLAMRGGSLEEVERHIDELVRRKRELLKGAGYPADYTDPHFWCSKCNDVGYDRTGRMCSCFRDALIIEQLNVSGLGNLAKTQSFDSFTLKYYEKASQDKVAVYRDRLRTYADNFKGEDEMSWLLTGGAGLGKTHLTTSAAVEIAKKGFDVLYLSEDDLFEEHREKQFGDGEADTDRFYEADLLIIDDLGVAKTNNLTAPFLFSVINKRQINGLSTIINTNLSRNEMQNKYGDRIVSRLWGYYNVLQFEGIDIRMQKLKEQINAH